MKLKILKEVKKENTCCFETFENNEQHFCGAIGVVSAGIDKYLCREHAKYASGLVKELQDEKGEHVTMKQFNTLLDYILV